MAWFFAIILFFLLIVTFSNSNNLTKELEALKKANETKSKELAENARADREKVEELTKKLKDRELINESLKLKTSDLENKLKPFQGIVDIDEQVRKLRQEEREVFATVQGLKQQIEKLRVEFEPLETENYARDFGLYEPKYNFDTSARYKAEIDRLRSDQKAAVKNGTAYWVPPNMTMNGSSSQGRKMVREIVQLQLRAFNGESEALIQKVRFDNLYKIEERIHDLYQKINVLDGETGSHITSAYLEMRLKELYLVHEYQEKRQAEAEEQRAIREQMREEEKAQRELDKALADAEREEQRYQAALEKAKREVETAVGAKQEALQSEIARLSSALAEAHAKSERAISMAQQTRVGHVYVISNIGSFGEDVYKIGMTRRLEPLERVRELSNASVPFNFDVHAVIYSEDAPKLETDLHRAFANRRVNLINQRKEFFRVSLDEIRNFVVSHHGEFEFTMAAEAADFRKSQQAHQA